MEVENSIQRIFSTLRFQKEDAIKSFKSISSQIKHGEDSKSLVKIETLTVLLQYGGLQKSEISSEIYVICKELFQPSCIEKSKNFNSILQFLAAIPPLLYADETIKIFKLLSTCVQENLCSSNADAAKPYLVMMDAMLSNNIDCNLEEIVADCIEMLVITTFNSTLKIISNALVKCFQCGNIRQTVKTESCIKILSLIAKSNLLENQLTLFEVIENILTLDLTNIASISAEFLASNAIWKMVQQGLCDPKTYIRKQAIYIFKKWISIIEIHNKEKNNIKFIHEIILLSESLEENQVHVLRPIFQQFLKLLPHVNSSCSLNPLSQNELHSSWIIALFKRILTHDSKLIIKDGIGILLDLQQDNIQFLDTTDGIEFIIKIVLPTLKDNFLQFCIEPQQDLFEKPNVAKHLDYFLVTYFNILHCKSKSIFLQSMIHHWSEDNWSYYTLFYFSWSLSMLPPTTAWERDELTSLKKLILKSNRLFPFRFSSTIENLLLDCMIKFSNTEKVALNDIISTLPNAIEFQKQTEVSKWIINNIAKFIDCGNMMDILSFNDGCLEKYLNQVSSFTSSDLKYTAVLSMSVIHSYTFTEHKEREQYFVKILNRLNMIIERAATHIYLSKNKILRAAALIASLYNNITGDLIALYSLYAERLTAGFLAYISIKVSTESFSDDEIDILKDVLHSLHAHAKVEPCQHENILVNIAQVSIKLFKMKVQSGNCCAEVIQALKFFEIVLELYHKYYSTDNSKQLMQSVLSDLDLLGTNIQIEYRTNNSKMFEKYVILQWSFLNYAVMVQDDFTTLLQKACEFCEIVSESNLHILINGVRKVINCRVTKYNETEKEQLSQTFKYFWTFITNLQHCSNFWQIYENFINALMVPSIILSVDVLNETVCDLLLQIVQKAQIKPKMLVLPCKNFTNILPLHNHSEKNIIQSFKTFIVQCLIFNHHPSKESNLKINSSYLTLRLSKIDVCAEFTSDIHPAEIVNLTMLNALLSLQYDSKIGQFILSELILELLHVDASVTKKKSIYHQNSIQHGIKDRVWQCVVCLCSHVQALHADDIMQNVLQCLKQDSQPSVRCLMEWCMIHLLIRFPSFEGNIVELMKSNKYLNWNSELGISFSGLCSCITIATCIGKYKWNIDGENSYLIDLVNICLPWCMCQHFSIRLYALASILSVKQQYEEYGRLNELIKWYPMIENCLQFAEYATGNVEKSWRKIKSNFMLFGIDFMNDLSIETIFTDIPRLCLSRFVERNIYASFQMWNSSQVSLQNKNAKIRDIDHGSWLPSSGKGGDELIEKNEDNPNNLQRKFVPWLDEMIQTSERQIQKKEPGLILVASLIDKTSNLGGLTRTCEIFGAESMIVQSLSCLNDKIYQSLAVTAHKWLTMKEVKPWELSKYLANMKMKGYLVVGTEQTANSVMLDKFKFPKKTVVVLGNEKEGIPTDILNEMDACIEIPQRGVIRSLNVHVSGAITVWEYTKQNSS